MRYPAMLREIFGSKNDLCGTGLTLLDNLRGFLTGKQAGRGPLFVSWDISDRCNAQCLMCDRWRKQTSDDISMEKRLLILEKLAGSGVKILSICGGEPFLMEGLGDFLKEAKKLRLRVNVTTNGSLISEKPELMKYLDILTISIDSHLAHEHDRARGFPGLFARISRSIDAVRRQAVRPRIYARRLVTKANIGRISDYIDHWKGKVDRIVFQPVHESLRIGFRVPEEFSANDAPGKDLEGGFRLALKKNRLFDPYNKGIFDFLFHPEEIKKRFNCYSGFFSLEIDNRGVLWNCGEHKLALGDLTNKPILKIINDARLPMLRLRGRRDCLCYHNCALINIYLSKMVNLLNLHNA